MSKIKNNPIMKGVSGMLGAVVVYREYRGDVIMANRPKRRDVLTPHQEKTKSKFLRAVQYAKKQVADPVTKTEYQPGPQSRFTSAYSAALADYLGALVVTSIDNSLYSGAIGDTLLINATDNFKVTVVHVSIFSVDGTLLEQGNATLIENSIEEYAYTATVVVGSKVLATVRDKPGNITVKEREL